MNHCMHKNDDGSCQIERLLKINIANACVTAFILGAMSASIILLMVSCATEKQPQNIEKILYLQEIEPKNN